MSTVKFVRTDRSTKVREWPMATPNRIYKNGKTPYFPVIFTVTQSGGLLHAYTAMEKFLPWSSWGSSECFWVRLRLVNYALRSLPYYLYHSELEPKRGRIFPSYGQQQTNKSVTTWTKKKTAVPPRSRRQPRMKASEWHLVYTLTGCWEVGCIARRDQRHVS